MGLFDQFKKKNTEEKESVSVSETDETNAAPGWDAITSAFEKLYPGQTNPKHYAPIISMRIGGNDPLDGISVYNGGEYWHFVTYGFSELYEKESEDQEYSGYGMEFTLKLKKDADADEEAEIRCVCGILQSLARLTFTKGEVFLPNEYIYMNISTPVRQRVWTPTDGQTSRALSPLPNRKRRRFVLLTASLFS